MSTDLTTHQITLEPRGLERPALLSLVCPAFNEEGNLPEFHKAVTEALNALSQPFEIVFVNDGSRDNTIGVMSAISIAHDNVAVIDLSRNFGKEIAITAGLDHAKGDAVIVMDTDLQHPPSLFGEFIAGWREGYDVVYAQRKTREEESWLRRKTAQAFYRVMNMSGDAALPENAGDFRLLSRKAVDAVVALRERHRFMKGVFAWIGFSTKAIPFEASPRFAGQSKWNYWKLWNFSIEGVTSHTLAPLKFSTYLGLVVAFFSFVYGFIVIANTILFGDPVPGFPTIATIVLFLGGVQLIVLGVMGEYLGRVFNETKQRPLYFARRVIESKVSGPKADR